MSVRLTAELRKQIREARDQKRRDEISVSIRAHNSLEREYLRRHGKVQAKK